LVIIGRDKKEEKVSLPAKKWREKIAQNTENSEDFGQFSFSWSLLLLLEHFWRAYAKPKFKFKFKS